MRRTLPFAGLIGFALWIGAEIVVFNLVASWVGGGAAFFLLVMKSVLGAVMVKRAVSRKLFEAFRRGGRGIVLDGAAASEAWMKGLGGFFLMAPGFVTGAAGLALLTPSLRRWIMGRGRPRPVNPREIELTAEEWRETTGAKRRLPRSRFDPD